MITRRRAVILGAALAASIPAAAWAAGVTQFASANFEAANKAGGPVLVHINATWCGTCKAQIPILSKLLEEPKYKAVKAFAVDYDSEKPVMRELKAPDRSTIILFKSGKEVARSTGDVTEDKIAGLIDKAL